MASSPSSYLEKRIEDLIGEVRTEGIDISFGEIINLHGSDPREIIIQPDYQRLFRWTYAQRSRLIESMLLGLPIPQIFVIENDDGVLELIDGLQRVSSVLHFVDHTLIGPQHVREQVAPDPLRLVGCDFLTELNGLTYEDLSQKLKFNLKRARVRMVTVKQSSNSLLRYEMFKRLNTGGSDLSSQEIRNCTARMVGNKGIQFYSFLSEMASLESFKTCIEPLAEATREEKGDHELVLRFLALKNSRNTFAQNVRDWLDSYMDAALLDKQNPAFDYDREKQLFIKYFDFLARKFGPGAFVKYRNRQAVGGLAPAYFEAVSIGLLPIYTQLEAQSRETLTATLADCVSATSFREVTGPAANTKAKLKGRIDLVTEAFNTLV